MNEIKVIEKENKRVMLTSDLASAYGTDNDTISKNFNRNKDKYELGKHYYCLEGEEKREFLNRGQFDGGLKNANRLYLWTEKGALLHAKSLNTEEAWEVYDRLVDFYFNVKEEKENQISMTNLSPELQMFKQIFDSVAKQEMMSKQALEESKKNTKQIQDMREVISLDTTSWRKDAHNLITKIAIKRGGTQYIRDTNSEIYKLLDMRYGVSLEQRLINKRRRMADEGICKSKRESLSKLDVIAEDKKLIEGYVAIIKELSIKEGVA